ncbi:MAG: coenzyme F420-0:L-glutamate ligase [Alphaproteobacteria bacterium]
MEGEVRLLALPGVPLVGPGSDLAGLALDGLARAGQRLEHGDVLVVAQKIVSKAEDRFVRLSDVRPSAEARTLARQAEKDPRVVELILAESSRVLRVRPGLIIAVHRLGFILANAGIDQSNVGAGEDEGRVLLWPRDPDASAESLRQELAARTGARLAVVVNDSVGRPWRLGTVGQAIGAAGLPALVDLRGRPDLFGRPLRVTMVALADQLAAAASLVQGEAGEGRPIVHVRGIALPPGASSAASLIRPESEDLFR